MNNTEESKELSGELLDILKYITFSNEGVTHDELASKFNISRPKAQYYTDVLLDLKFISRPTVSFDGPDYYYPSKEGRKYLFDRNLL